MNNKHLLVKSITLLFLEGQLTGTREKSSDLVRKVLTLIKLPEGNLGGVDYERDQLINLKRTTLNMCDDSAEHEYERMELLQRLMVDCGDDSLTYDALKSGIEPTLSEESVKRNCLNLRRELNNHFRDEEVKRILNEATAKMRFKPEEVKDMKSFSRDLIQQLEPYQVDTIIRDPAIVSEVNMASQAEMEKAFEDVKSLDDGGAVLRSGWQGLNRMLRGGPRRGEQIVVGALQHKFKTGFTLGLFRQFAQYNTPHMIDPTKKPLLLRISFEDNLPNNLQFLYAGLKENELKRPLSDADKDISSEEMSAYVMEKMQVNGYHVKMLRVDPSQWGYKDICNYILQMEAEGYEVHVLMLDYLAMVPTKGCDQGPMGYDKRDLFRRMRNFTSPRGILLMTPHQLSTEAKQLIRNGQNDFVKEIAEKGYYADCRQIDQEVDAEIYIHIEYVNGKAYLTVQRGKHRLSGVTPLKDKYFAIPFLPQDWSSGILDDVDGADTSMLRPGGGTVGSGTDTSPFWETEMAPAF